MVSTFKRLVGVTQQTAFGLTKINRGLPLMTEIENPRVLCQFLPFFLRGIMGDRTNHSSCDILGLNYHFI
jgi:hypothetical protein